MRKLPYELFRLPLVTT